MISQSFMRRMYYVHVAPSINKLKIHDYHKTTLVSECVQYIIQSVCSKQYCFIFKGTRGRKLISHFISV